MKYILHKNLLNNTKKNKLFLLYIILILVYLLINISILSYYSDKEYASFLGIAKVTKEINVFDIILKLLSFSVVIYYATKTFIYNILNNLELISLRINKKKWIFLELINGIVYISILRLTINVITITIFSKYNNTILFSNMINILLHDIIFYLILFAFIFLIVNLYTYSKFFLILIIFIYLMLKIDIYKINILLLIIVFLLIFILNIIIFNISKLYSIYQKK